MRVMLWALALCGAVFGGKVYAAPFDVWYVAYVNCPGGFCTGSDPIAPWTQLIPYFKAAGGGVGCSYAHTLISTSGVSTASGSAAITQHRNDETTDSCPPPDTTEVASSIQCTAGKVLSSGGACVDQAEAGVCTAKTGKVYDGWVSASSNPSTVCQAGCTAELVQASNQYAINGTQVIGGTWSYTGGQCQGTETGGASATLPTTATTCPKGSYPGTVNNVHVCLAATETAPQKEWSAAKETTSTTTAGGTTTPGATTTTTNVTNNTTTGTSVQSTTVVTNPDGSKTTSTKSGLPDGDEKGAECGTVKTADCNVNVKSIDEKESASAAARADAGTKGQGAVDALTARTTAFNSAAGAADAGLTGITGLTQFSAPSVSDVSLDGLLPSSSECVAMSLPEFHGVAMQLDYCAFANYSKPIMEWFLYVMAFLYVVFAFTRRRSEV